MNAWVLLLAAAAAPLWLGGLLLGAGLIAAGLLRRWTS